MLDLRIEFERCGNIAKSVRHGMQNGKYARTMDRGISTSSLIRTLALVALLRFLLASRTVHLSLAAIAASIASRELSLVIIPAGRPDRPQPRAFLSLSHITSFTVNMTKHAQIVRGQAPHGTGYPYLRSLRAPENLPPRGQSPRIDL